MVDRRRRIFISNGVCQALCLTQEPAVNGVGTFLRWPNAPAQPNYFSRLKHI